MILGIKIILNHLTSRERVLLTKEDNLTSKLFAVLEKKMLKTTID